MVDTLESCTSGGYSDLSPFCPRADKWSKPQSPKVSGRFSTDTSIDQSSSSDEEQALEVRYVADEGIDVVRTRFDSHDVYNPSLSLLGISPSEAYGKAINWQPSRHDRNAYHRYIAVDSILGKFIPLSAFTQDSSRHVEPPTVDKYSRQIYDKSLSDSSEYPLACLTSPKVYSDYLGMVSFVESCQG